MVRLDDGKFVTLMLKMIVFVGLGGTRSPSGGMTYCLGTIDATLDDSGPAAAFAESAEKV